jgi:outer membrane murein-binding lipoprotein Lpp
MVRGILRIIVLSVAGTALVVGSFLYFKKGPCEEPLAYSIGTIDPRFGVSEETFKQDLVEASAIWEKPLQKPLFMYDPKGALVINLVYDSRQQITQNEQVLNSKISQTSQTADAVKQQYTALRADYERAQGIYTAQLAAFNEAQSAYNAEVSHWNSVGGAPQKRYEALMAEKADLQAKQKALEQERLTVNALADSVNAFINKYNLLVSYINSNIRAINNDGLAGTQFEEGVYVSDESGRRINIYQFANRVDLVRVLAHELGHSLGLGHNANQNSIMNPVNQSDSLTVSAEDLQALKTVCGMQ